VFLSGDAAGQKGEPSEALEEDCGWKAIEKVAEVTSEWVATVAASAEQFPEDEVAKRSEENPSQWRRQWIFKRTLR